MRSVHLLFEIQWLKCTDTRIEVEIDFIMLAACENNAEVSLNIDTQQIIEKWNICARKWMRHGHSISLYFKWLPDKDRVSRWKFKMVCFKGLFYFNMSEVISGLSQGTLKYDRNQELFKQMKSTLFLL